MTQVASTGQRVRTPELLAPAGSPEAFAAALAGGADAIYLGRGDFNARRKARNFSDDEFRDACRAAHLAGARVYVTVNIVIKESEMPAALELVRHCTELGADAFIIQDWGLHALVRRLMPQVETHISTQANIHDARGAAWCRAAGAERVTLSRELTVAEIGEISRACPDLDLEVFAHGAICFSYSGVCLLSSFCCAGRSANRGMCAQPCRLPYELLDEQGRTISAPGRERALCPRDNNTVDLLPDLLEAGAHALKLEGRMKAPDYVLSVVDAYRHQLDDILAGRAIAADERDLRARQLKRAFNRDFTSAYQHGRSGDEMMSYERSNNRGQVVGEVLGSKTVGSGPTRCPEDRRNRVAIARIRLWEPVGKGDLVEIRHDDEFDRFLTYTATEDARAGEVVEARIPRAMPAGSRVRVIRSAEALKAAAAVAKRPVMRKRAVHVRVVARIGEPFAVELACADDASLAARAEGAPVESARTRAVSQEDLVEHVGRMGSSPFEAVGFTVELDSGVGLGFSGVHAVRAAACEALERLILNRCRVEVPRQLDLSVLDADAATQMAGGRVPEVCAIVASVELAEVARAAGAARVYVGTDALEEAGVTPAEAARDGLVPVLDEVCRAADHARLDPWVRADGTVAVGNISELALAAERGTVAEVRSCIPVHNAACARALEAAGARGFWLSPEISLDELEELVPRIGAPAGAVVMGRPRVMTSEHCILQVADRCIHDCARCGLRRRRLSLRNIDGKELPVRTDIHGRSHLYDSFPLDLTPQMGRMAAAGVTRFAVDGTLMDAAELERAVARVVRAADAVRAGRKPAKRLAGHTSGCLYVGIS